MNKPKRIEPIGGEPLDAEGQRMLGPDEEAALDRVRNDPAFLAAIAEAEAEIRAGRFFTHEEVLAHCAERRRRWLAERGM